MIQGSVKNFPPLDTMFFQNGFIEEYKALLTQIRIASKIELKLNFDTFYSEDVWHRKTGCLRGDFS
jgi:hypothetical protein